MNATWEQAIQRTSEVIAKHGGRFMDIETGKLLDPGQIICREAYGKDWMNSEDFKICDAAPECPDSYMQAAARIIKQLPSWCVVIP